MSTDVTTRYQQRYKVAPLRIPADELDAETFKEMLVEQDRRAIETAELREDKAKEMTKDLFFEILSDPAAKKRRQARTEKQRMIQALEYFDRIDKDLWVNDQMQILEAYLDRYRLQVRKEAYNTWRKGFLDHILKMAKVVRMKHGAEKAKAFMEFGYDFADSKRPTDIQPFTKIIRRRIRRLSLQTDMEAMRRFSEELHPLLSKKAKEQKLVTKHKRGRPKKKKDLPKGKFPFLSNPKGDNEHPVS